MNTVEASPVRPDADVPDDVSSLLAVSVPEGWSDLDRRAVDTVRVLAADAVQRCGSGHPGTAMSLAPLAYTLFQRVMRHDPADPGWAGRDRFVLSCGHSSLTLYLQLFLAGYGLEVEDLQQLRTWGSRTPGHPEYGHTAGVEITTGPLGQGLGAAVGMAMAARRERGLVDPDAAPGESPFDHRIYVIASDGDIEEGVTAEASSLAGRQQLGNLVVIYDDNRISIEDDTSIALSEDVAKRYEAYGWHVQSVCGGENVAGICDALERAAAETDRPSFIVLRTVIGFPAPEKMNTGAAHGAALGDDEVAQVKTILGFDPERSFAVDDDVLAHTRGIRERARDVRRTWQDSFDAWAATNPDRHELWRRMSRRELPDGWAENLPDWSADDDALATRKALAAVLASVGDVLPELWGGSADLAESNNTTIEGADSFGPSSIATEKWGQASPYGRTLHFGVREHAMGAVLNGIALHGGTRAYGGTFMVFSDYMRPAVRLAALMELPTIYVWTHDSIGLGEDGPTHQPVEHLAALRAIPGLALVRPADARETAAAFRRVLERPDGPAGLALTRQNVPILEGVTGEGVRRGGYTIAEADGGGAPELLLIATGSEVALALSARDVLQGEGVPTRVVSMPCVEWFDAEDESYRDGILPPATTARVAVEAAIGMPWRRFVGDRGEIVSLEHFGASADHQTLYEQFGLTVDAVVDAARRSLSRAST
ncbi:transketolase [Actinomycetospora chlora]|uniref:Transketolase n=1 Tax=Actinomycetospora chlora TaxID=663608 RepID=A0ABP9A7F7_9PSEU